MSSRGTNWDPVVGHIGAFSEWPSHEGGMAIMLLVSTPSSDTCAALHSVDALFVFHNQWGERCFPKLMHLVCLHAYLKMGWTTHSKIVLHSGSSRTFPKLRKACAIWKKRKQFAEKKYSLLRVRWSRALCNKMFWQFQMWKIFNWTRTQQGPIEINILGWHVLTS